VIAKQSAVKIYVATLSADERERLNTLIQKGTCPVRQVLKARILLKADASAAGEAWSDGQIATGHQHRHHRTHASAAGGERPRCSPDQQALSQLRQKAHLRRCRRGKADRARLLSAAERTQAVDAHAAGNRGRAAEHRRSRQRQHDWADAQKNTLKPHRQKQWVIPPEASAAFVASMEDVLEVYQRPHDADRSVVCLDETTKQLIKETRVPVPAKSGQPARHGVMPRLAPPQPSACASARDDASLGINRRLQHGHERDNPSAPSSLNSRQRDVSSSLLGWTAPRHRVPELGL
jgi:hypothetical protein